MNGEGVYILSQGYIQIICACESADHFCNQIEIVLVECGAKKTKSLVIQPYWKEMKCAQIDVFFCMCSEFECKQFQESLCSLAGRTDVSNVVDLETTFELEFYASIPEILSNTKTIFLRCFILKENN